MNDRQWHTSSYSGGSTGQCVEVAEGVVTGVRDSRHRDTGHLEFGAAEWARFIDGVRAGEL